MTTRTYWEGSRFVAEWTLSDPDGDPITGATVTGTISTPSGTSTTMTVTSAGNVYTAWYDVTEAGRHAYRLTAAGTGIDAHEGTFVARRSLVGLPPITLDPTTDVGMIRLLITDVDEDAPLFEDAQLAAFLDREDGSVKLAAATALETIARSEVLIGKKITTQDLSTDAPAVARELRESAAALRKQVEKDEQDADDDAATGLLPLYSFPAPVPWGDWYL